MYILHVLDIVERLDFAQDHGRNLIDGAELVPVHTEHRDGDGNVL